MITYASFLLKYHIQHEETGRKTKSLLLHTFKCHFKLWANVDAFGGNVMMYVLERGSDVLKVGAVIFSTLWLFSHLQIPVKNSLHFVFLLCDGTAVSDVTFG